MKRSSQVSLVLVAAVGIGGTAAMTMPQDRCRAQPESAAASAVANDVQQDCRSRGSSGSHGGSSYSWWGTGGSKSSTSSSSASGSEATARGGFGSIGHAFASLGG
jgi:hypothetical protein